MKKEIHKKYSVIVDSQCPDCPCNKRQRLYCREFRTLGEARSNFKMHKQYIKKNNCIKWTITLRKAVLTLGDNPDISFKTLSELTYLGKNIWLDV